MPKAPPTITLTIDNRVGVFAEQAPHSKVYNTTVIRFDPTIKCVIASDGRAIASSAVEVAGDMPELFFDGVAYDRICPTRAGQVRVLEYRDGRLYDKDNDTAPIKIYVNDQLEKSEQIQYPSLPRESNIALHTVMTTVSAKALRQICHQLILDRDERVILTFDVSPQMVSTGSVGFHIIRDKEPVVAGLMMPPELAADAMKSLVDKSVKKLFIREGKISKAKAAPEPKAATKTVTKPEPAATTKAEPAKRDTNVAKPGEKNYMTAADCKASSDRLQKLGEKLMAAAGRSDYDECLSLLDQFASVKVTDKGGYNALTRASRTENPKLVKLLIDRGFKVDHKPSTNITALQTAAFHGHIENCRVLLKAGASPTLKDNYDYNAIEKAEEKGHTAVVKLLKSYAK